MTAPRRCAHCGATFDAATDYAGNPQRPQRKYCGRECLRLRRHRPRDVDEVAVERVCHGDRSITLTRAETRAAFQWLRERGYSARSIARRLGVTDRTVWRWIAAQRETTERKAS